jgi:hypothetical protein
VSIEFTDALQALWFVEIPGGDWLCGLYSRRDGRFDMTYRFRWYRGPAVWDSNDVKNWFEATGDDYSQCLHGIREMIKGMRSAGAGESWELLRGTKTTREFIEELRKTPFAHTKKVSQAEFEQMQRDGRV